MMPKVIFKFVSKVNFNNAANLASKIMIKKASYDILKTRYFMVSIPRTFYSSILDISNKSD